VTIDKAEYGVSAHELSVINVLALGKFCRAVVRLSSSAHTNIVFAVCVNRSVDSKRNFSV
jgi:hypothetical protein